LPDGPGDDIKHLADLLAESRFRRSYQGKIGQGLRAKGMDPNKIPRSLLKALNGLSADELQAVSAANRKLEAAGLTGDRMTRLPSLLKLPV
jgi:hypothetical protein